MILGVHNCTKSDYEKFWKPQNGTEGRFEQMKSTNDLLCLDRKDIFGSPVDFNIHGSEKYGVVREINIIYRPCIPRTHGDTCVIKDAHN